jgi:DNA-binding NtrC family response regulator
MAKVMLIGLEYSTANQLGHALQDDRHQIELKPNTARAEELLDADIIFADGSEKRYLSLLRSIRKLKPRLPFVVVTRLPEITDWLDALEAGATDYCSAPFERRQIMWILDSAFARLMGVAAAAA